MQMFCRRTPPPPKFSFPLTDFEVIFVDLGPFSSREQWYHGLNKLEVLSLNFYSFLFLGIDGLAMINDEILILRTGRSTLLRVGCQF